MPLPASGTKDWPPKEWEAIYDEYALNAAWYSGDPNNLATVYAGLVSPFWSRAVNVERRTTLHMPLAGDISATSAAMLFSEHPRISIPEGALAVQKAARTQERLEQIIEDSRFYAHLLQAAETCSAMGGVFIKIDWDEEFADYPIISVVQADNALPEFRYGRLQAVTFHQQLESDPDSSVVWRLVERHEPGIILSGLYKGTSDRLGTQLDLGSRGDTAHIAPVVETGIDELLCVYVPNSLPNRRHRTSALGMSDYNGLDGLMGALDETWSSWMRDIRLGVGRIIAPQEFFAKDSSDGAWKFDVDKEAYMALNAPIGADGLKNQITVNQFALRAAEHSQTCTALMMEIVTRAGYSPQSFGLNIEGRAESGTALTIRERKSLITTAKKGEYWAPCVAQLLELMLAVDKLHLGNRRVEVVRPQVEMQDSIRPATEELARSVQMISAAQAASAETLVSMLHPDWTAERVAQEAEAVKLEQGMLVPNPLTLTGAEE